jgi:osmotically inducible protein OsmC
MSEYGDPISPEQVEFAVEGSLELRRSAPRCSLGLVTEAEVPGIDADAFSVHAQAAKSGCPVSKALAAVAISLEARLLEVQLS